MTTYSLVEPFEIDNGELDNLTPQECFSLGVEWQIFRTQLSEGNPFTSLVLSNNAGRLTALAERAQRFVEARPANDGWALITVGDYRV